MAGKLPAPVVFIILTAIESVAVLQYLSRYLTDTPLKYVFGSAVAVNLVSYGFYTLYIYPYFVSPLRHLPGPKGGLPLVGHGLVAFKRPPGGDFLRWITTIPHDGILMFHGILHKPNLLITSPRALSDVLVAKAYDFQKPKPARDLLRMVLGEGLVVAEGEIHRFQRKNIQPMFGFRQIKELYPMMMGKAVTMTKCVAEELQSGLEATAEKSGWAILEMETWASRATLDIIGVAGLGREFNVLRNADDDLVKNYTFILEPSKEKLRWFAAMITMGMDVLKMIPWKMTTNMKKATDNLDIVCRQLLRDKKEAIKMGGDDHIDILSSLMKSNNFSDDELVDQLLTFLAAGHETTSSSMAWSLYLLAKNTAVQKRLRDEIHASIPNVDAIGDLAGTLESLPYLNGVCYETLRIFPTVPFTRRIAVRDTRILDQHIPSGTLLEMSIWATNRDPKLWGNAADQFIPERWIDGDANPDGSKVDGKPNNHGGAPSNYALLTFLHGPRSCIGQGFAKAELRVLLAAFVGAFEFELAEPGKEIVPFGMVTMKPMGGLHLKVRKVKDW